MERPAEKVGKVASKLLKQTVDNYDDEQIKLALAELQENGRIETMPVEEIARYVRQKELVPKLKQFKDRAVETLGGLNVIDPIKSTILDALRQDDALKETIAALFPVQEGFNRQAAAGEVLRIVNGRIRDAVSDEPSNERSKYIGGLVTDLMADNVLKSLVK